MLNHSCASFLLSALILVSLVSCSSETSEARRFSKLLNKQTHSLDELNTQEGMLMQTFQGWIRDQTFYGILSPGGGPLDQQRLKQAQNAVYFKNHMSPLKGQLTSLTEQLKAEQLKTPYVQTIRSGIVSRLDARAAQFSDLLSLLDAYGHELSNPPEPGGEPTAVVNSMAGKIGTYQAPSNSIAKALQDLRLKYSLSDSDIAN